MTPADVMASSGRIAPARRGMMMLQHSNTNLLCVQASGQKKTANCVEKTSSYRACREFRLTWIVTNFCTSKPSLACHIGLTKSPHVCTTQSVVAHFLGIERERTELFLEAAKTRSVSISLYVEHVFLEKRSCQAICQMIWRHRVSRLHAQQPHPDNPTLVFLTYESLVQHACPLSSQTHER